MDFSNIWVIIPAFNEGEVLGDVVRETIKTFPSIVVVDDHSSDNTAAVAAAAGAHIVRHPVNMGQGASLQTGFDYALSDPDMQAVITFDADGQHSLSDAADMVQRLGNEDLDVVLGSRFLDDRTQVSAQKKVILKLAAKWSAWCTGMDLTDAHNGLRVISRDTLEKIHLYQNGMAHASEIVDQFGELKVKYAEHPTYIKYTEYSKSKGQPLLNSVNILTDLLVK